MMRRRVPTAVTAGLAVAAVACAALLTPVASSSAAAASAPDHGHHIAFTARTCAPHWRPPNPGRRRFLVANRSGVSATVYLYRPLTDHIVGELDHLKGHTTRPLVVHLEPGGRYAWGCDLNGRPPRSSETETVPVDPVHGGPGRRVIPISRDELAPAMKAYRAYVTDLLSELASELTTLSGDLSAQDVPAAEADWLRAHRTWLRIGQDDGAYSAFGSHGLAIDGTAAGLRGGEKSPDFAGFHRIELDLWTHHDTGAAEVDTAALSRAVSRLAGHPISFWLPYSTAGVSGLPLRTHEVLEDALRDTLTGDDDYGSGTGLASVRADVSATRELLSLVAPLLKPRAPHLVTKASHSLSRLAHAAENGRRADGQWIAVADLGRTRREAVDAAIGDALERLDRVPDLLMIGNS